MSTNNNMHKYLIVIIPMLCCFKATTYQASSLFSDSISLEQIQQDSTTTVRSHKQERKPWTIVVYIAADNDLRGFAARNIKQMASVGSNEHINILVHLDIRIARDQKITRRYYIENNKILHVNPDDPKTERMDSGCPKTLCSCCKWAIKNYPADHYALFLWNHGTGIIDPARGRILNPVQLFSFNRRSNTFDVDRSIEFFDWVNNGANRGMCWDDTTGNYLTNQKLDAALQKVCSKYLDGNKFAFIAFDACLMSMLEVANIIKKHAHIMVGSQEVELGTGYNYSLALAPFKEGSISPEEFARQIVAAYQQSYGNITNDYTQSAVDLAKVSAIEKNAHEVAALLLQCLHQQVNNSVKNSLKRSRNKLNCTHFDEPRYIDLHHFYTNILKNIDSFRLKSNNPQGLISALKKKIKTGTELIEQAVIENTTGRNLHQAKGISIYFPEDVIHPSYVKTTFANETDWVKLIR